jgi:hypothetical protein
MRHGAPVVFRQHPLPLRRSLAILPPDVIAVGVGFSSSGAANSFSSSI